MQLAPVPDLPNSIKQLIENRTEQSANAKASVEGSSRLFSDLPCSLARQLRMVSEQTVESGIPWSALAGLLEEEQFIEVAHYIVDARNAIERSLAADVEAAMPLIHNHRYAPYISSFRYNLADQSYQAQELLGTVKIVDPRMSMRYMLHFLENSVGPDRQSIGRAAVLHAHRNFTVPGLFEYMMPYGFKGPAMPQEIGQQLIDEMQAMAPYSDLGVGRAILWAQDPTLEQLKEWESKLKMDPWGYASLAELYRKYGDLDAAIRCCEKSASLEKNVNTAVQLSDLYRDRHELAKWEQTLLEYLNVEDIGLEHDCIHALLAWGYIAQGQWQKAKPHAIESAQTSAGKGYMMAAQVCEGLAQWAESEHWTRECSQAFPRSSACLWYFWCRRTGRGDVTSAHRMAAEYAALPHVTTSENEMVLGTYYALEGDTHAALKAFRRAMADRPNYQCTFMVAQLAHDVYDPRLRSATLATMQTYCLEHMAGAEPDKTQVHAAGLAIMQLMKSGDTAPERLQEIDALLGDVDETTRSAFAYFIGRELEARGDTTQAERYWRRSIAMPHRDEHFATLAGCELAKRHGTSRADDDQLDQDDLWPAAAVQD